MITNLLLAVEDMLVALEPHRGLLPADANEAYAKVAARLADIEDHLSPSTIADVTWEPR